MTLFENTEQMGLYKLAHEGARSAEVAEEALALLERNANLLTVGEKWRLTELRVKLDMRTQPV